MVATSQRDGETFFECEVCGMLFPNEDEASQHESTCDDSDPDYLQ
jgi:uncharacterized C2H2 Zn-finger protein